MRSRQLSDLRQDVRWLADIVGNASFADGDIDERINTGLAEIFRMLVSDKQDAYFRKSTTLGLTANTSVYPLPNDFYAVLAVECNIGTGDSIVLTSFSATERPYLASTTPGWSGEPVRYAIEGKQTYSDVGSIEFLPAPSAGLSITLRYVWAPGKLASDTDTFDGIAGFEDYAVLFAARRCAMKQSRWETVSALGQEMTRVEGQIRGASKQRDAFMPGKVTQVRNLWRPRYSRRGQ